MSHLEAGPDGLVSPSPSPRPRVPHSQAQMPKQVAAVGAAPTHGATYGTSPRVPPHRNHFRESSHAPLFGRNRKWVRCRNCFVVALLLVQLPLLAFYAAPFLPQINDTGIGRFAYATLLCDDAMAEACAVMVHSLRQSGTTKDILVLTGNLSANSLQLLKQVGAIPEPITDPVPYPFPATQGRLAINKPCRYSKLLLWNMTRYDKIVYLDSDMLVLRPLDSLFQRPAIAAVPDSMPPDRFNSGLMVLRPSGAIFQDMLSRVNSTPSPNVGDQGFLNEYFSDWYRQGGEHHLDYGFNALVRMNSAATWRAWVEPKLHVLHFSGAGKPWNMRADPGQPTERKLDHLWWAAFYSMHETMAKQGRPMAKLDPMCRTDFMAYGRNIEGGTDKKLSVLLQAVGGRKELTAYLVKKYAAMRIVRAVYVVWSGPKVDLNLGRDNVVMGKPVEVISAPHGRPSERFQPIRSLETECVFMCHHDVEISEEVMQVAFQRWKDNPYRLVGFYPRAHYKTKKVGGSLVYVGRPRVEYSMVLQRMALLHADYLRAYTCQTPPGVRDAVEKTPECFDVALNFMTSHLSGLSPLLVLDSGKRDFQDRQESPLQAAADASGSQCLRSMEGLWGYAPLKNTSEAVSVYTSNAAVRSYLSGKEAKATALQTEWAPVFDFRGAVSRHPDENLKFMPLVEVSLHVPELSLVPSEAGSHMALLCVRGNDTNRGADSTNQYALVHHTGVPANALLLEGTTFIALSRHGFDDHPLMLLDLLGSFFQYCIEHSGFAGQRILLYRRGGWVPWMAEGSLALTQALLGNHMEPMAIPEGTRPVCLERAIVVRRNRGDLADRPGILPQMRDSIWSYCAGGRRPNSTRVTILEDGRQTARGRIQNAAEIFGQLKRTCGNQCRPFTASFSANASFCQQVRAMKTAAVVIGAHGEALASSLLFMAPGALVLELAAPRGSSGAPIEFREYSLDKDAAALSVRVKRLVMPESARGGALPGYLVRASAPLVARAALQEVEERTRREGSRNQQVQRGKTETGGAKPGRASGRGTGRRLEQVEERDWRIQEEGEGGGGNRWEAAIGREETAGAAVPDTSLVHSESESAGAGRVSDSEAERREGWGRGGGGGGEGGWGWEGSGREEFDVATSDVALEGGVQVWRQGRSKAREAGAGVVTDGVEKRRSSPTWWGLRLGDWRILRQNPARLLCWVPFRGCVNGKAGPEVRVAATQIEGENSDRHRSDRETKGSDRAAGFPDDEVGTSRLDGRQQSRGRPDFVDLQSGRAGKKSAGSPHRISEDRNVAVLSSGRSLTDIPTGPIERGQVDDGTASSRR